MLPADSRHFLAHSSAASTMHLRVCCIC